MAENKPRVNRLRIKDLETDTLSLAGAAVPSGTQAAAIADHADTAAATAEECAVKQNAILAALRTFGIIAAE